jgi:hypothetical protein
VVRVCVCARADGEPVAKNKKSDVSVRENGSAG